MPVFHRHFHPCLHPHIHPHIHPHLHPPRGVDYLHDAPALTARRSAERALLPAITPRATRRTNPSRLSFRMDRLVVFADLPVMMVALSWQQGEVCASNSAS